MKSLITFFLMILSLSAFADKSQVNCDLEKEGYSEFSYIILNAYKVMIKFKRDDVSGYLNVQGHPQTKISDETVFIEVGKLTFMLPLELFNSQINTPFSGYVKTVEENSTSITAASCYLIN